MLTDFLLTNKSLSLSFKKTSNPVTVVSDPNLSNDDIVINYTASPGGTFSPFNEGAVAVHELGRWLGLLDIFDGTSCTGEGDGIADTPQQKEATLGCPTGQDVRIIAAVDDDNLVRASRLIPFLCI